MATKEVKTTAKEVVELIRGKYPSGAYCVLEQVADGTGAGVGSWIDAAVFSLWPSNGIWRAACEVKVSRADWLKELARPAKNEWARKHFDFFWYVTASGVVKDGEVPEGCGLMTVRGNGLSIVKHAPRREEVATDNSIIASFARSLDKERERFRRDELQRAIEGNCDYQQAKCFHEAAERYLRHCGQRTYLTGSDEIFAELMKTRGGDSFAEESEHVHRVLERFKEDVLKFVLDIAPLASNVINARDETAKLIVDAWGGRDKASLEALKALAKTKAGRRYEPSLAEAQVAISDLTEAVNP